MSKYGIDNNIIIVNQTDGRQSNIHTCTRTIWMMSPIVQQNIV